MARRRRVSPGGYAYHVMNRGIAGLKLFADDGDYDAFLRVLEEGRRRFSGVRVCAYCLLPNHFHLVLWPRDDDLLSRFMQWLTATHTQRWHAHRHSAGRGHLYQSRFKSFPIEQDQHFLTVCRYVERNALRANLVRKAEKWQWGSLYTWLEARNRQAPAGAKDKDASRCRPCDDWPVTRPRDWLALTNRPQRPDEVEAVRRCAQRGTPFGSEIWTQHTATALDLDATLRPRGRPPKKSQ